MLANFCHALSFTTKRASSGAQFQTKSHQNSKAVGSVFVPNGFALDPDAVTPGRSSWLWGNPHLYPRQAPQGIKAPVRSSEITKASKGSFVAARWRGCLGSVSAPELGLSAGSTVRILTR
jgi:hypothetical protein